MQVGALIFDFDGLIVDTETPDYEVWRDIFAEHGARLELAAWAGCIGREYGYIDPVAMLEDRLGRPLDRMAIKAERKRRFMARLSGQPPRPGVTAYLDEAARLGLPVAVASSAPRAWVEPRLAALGLAGRFAAVKCREDAPRAKPAPDLFLSAAAVLGAAPENCVALEDSPNGISAARAAGMFCLAVPNEVTRRLDLSAADFIVQSLSQLPLSELIDRLSRTG
jgi:HAD superfamily hydrolase (TIGR01509 family)